MVVCHCRHRATDGGRATPGCWLGSRWWPIWPGVTGCGALVLLDPAFDEVQGHVADFAPAVVDDKSVPAVGHGDRLGHAGVLALLVEDGLGDGRWGGVVLLAGD